MTAFTFLIKVWYDQLMYEKSLFHYQIIGSEPGPICDENISDVKNFWQ